MNAYELADELDKVLTFVDLPKSTYSKMLRQQADQLAKADARIAELEVTKFHLEGDINRLEDQVNELLVAKHFKDMGRTK